MVPISIKNVTKCFGKTVAVDNVSIDIRAGSLFFLLGPSGCGKTTILRMIAGFCDIDEGDILLGGKSIKDVEPGKRNVAMVFQNYALWPHLSVFRNVAYGLEERAVKSEELKQRVMEALKRVQMDDYEKRMPAELSGGQQQRVALARALVVKPDVVLLDEPLSNLDAKLRNEMRHEIRRIHDLTGVTMLYVTHDQKEALTMADDIAIMSMGRLEQVGEPEHIYKNPSNSFVASFMGEANLFTGKVSQSSSKTVQIETKAGVFTVLSDAGYKVGAKVICMIRPENIEIGTSRENIIKAKVTDRIYFGESEQYILKSSGYQIKCLIHAGMTKRIDKGDEISISFSALDACVLDNTKKEAE